MQTERVTFLTTPDHKAALDAFARESGMSVGHVVREATNQFIAQPTAEEEAELRVLTDQVNDAVPKMTASIDRIVATLDRTHAETDAFLRRMGVR
jgi:predicted HD phosphohydrolase